LVALVEDEACVAVPSGISGYIRLPFASASPRAAGERSASGVRPLPDGAPREEWIRQAAARLTPQERAILTYIARGYSNKSVADVLFIAEATVKYHLTNILKKLRLRNRTGLAAFALDYNLVRAEEIAWLRCECGEADCDRQVELWHDDNRLFARQPVLHRECFRRRHAALLDPNRP
jgi:DNA-binding CsgD family transcriptional regulator